MRINCFFFLAGTIACILVTSIRQHIMQEPCHIALVLLAYVIAVLFILQCTRHVISHCKKACKRLMKRRSVSRCQTSGSSLLAIFVLFALVQSVSAVYPPCVAMTAESASYLPAIATGTTVGAMLDSGDSGHSASEVESEFEVEHQPTPRRKESLDISMINNTAVFRMNDRTAEVTVHVTGHQMWFNFSNTLELLNGTAINQQQLKLATKWLLRWDDKKEHTQYFHTGKAGRPSMWLDDCAFAVVVANSVQKCYPYPKTAAAIFQALAAKPLSQYLNRDGQTSTNITSTDTEVQQWQKQGKITKKHLFRPYCFRHLRESESVQAAKELLAMIEANATARDRKWTLDNILELTHVLRRAGKLLADILQVASKAPDTTEASPSLKIDSLWEMTVQPLRIFLNSLHLRRGAATCTASNGTKLLLANLMVRLVNPKTVPPLMTAIGHMVMYGSLEERMDICSRLRVTPSDTHVRQVLQREAAKIDTSCKEDCDYILSWDNVQQKISCGQHHLERRDVTYVHGVTICGRAVPPTPDCYSKVDTKEPKELSSDFLKKTSKENWWLQSYMEAVANYSNNILKDFNSPENPSLEDIWPAVVGIPADPPAKQPRTAHAPPIQQLVTLEVPPEGQLEPPSPDSQSGVSWHGKCQYFLDRVVIGHSEDSKTVRTVMDYIRDKYVTVGRKQVFVMTDQKLYTILQRLKPTHAYDNLSLLLDPFHTTWTMEKAIYAQFSKAGLRELMAVLGYTNDEHFMYLRDCKEVHRSHYILQEVAIAIQAEAIWLFQQTNCSRHDAHWYQSFEEWKNSTASRNKQFKLWAVLFQEVVSLACAAWDGTRLGNWLLFKAAVKGFAPYFFAWNRHNYDHSTVEFLRDMACHSSYEEAGLEMGSAFVNVSGAELANVSIGYLNELMNKALKQTTKHLDVDGQAWQSSQQNMPALMQIKENLQQQLGLDYAAHRQAHIPTTNHINRLRFLIRNWKVLGVEHDWIAPHQESTMVPAGMEDHWQQLWMNQKPTTHQAIATTGQNTAVNWFSGNAVSDLFLESWQKGNEAAQQLAQLIIANNNRGCTEKLKRKLSVQYKVPVLHTTKRPSLRSTKATVPSSAEKQAILKGQQQPLYAIERPLCFTKDGKTARSTMKSVCLKVCQKQWGCQSAPTNRYGAVIIDIMTRLFCRPPPSTHGITAYTQYFIKTYIFPYFLRCGTNTVVLCFDKPKYQGSWKGYTQHIARQSSDPIQLLRTFHFTEFISSSRLPQWEWIRQSRQLRYELIYAMVANMVTVPQRYLRRSHNFTLIIDGGYPQTDERSAPIQIECRDASFTVCLRPDLANSHGEADQAAPFFTQHFCNKGDVLVVAGDTDVFNNVLLLAPKLMQGTTNAIHYDAMGLGWRPTSSCFHTNLTQLNTAISSDLRLQNLKHPVEGVVWAFLSSGACDYNGSFHGFSPITFLEALTEYFRRDILYEDENGCLQPAYNTHTAFIKAAYYQKNKSKLAKWQAPLHSDPKKWTKQQLVWYVTEEKVQHTGKRKGDLVSAVNTHLVNTQHRQALLARYVEPGDEGTLASVDYHTVLKEVWLTTADPAKWMPLDDPLQQHFRRTSMAWKVWSTAWHPKPSLPSGQLLLSCGYLCRESIDPISATNIAYNFGNNSNGSRPNKRKQPAKSNSGAKRRCQRAGALVRANGQQATTAQVTLHSTPALPQTALLHAPPHLPPPATLHTTASSNTEPCVMQRMFPTDFDFVQLGVLHIPPLSP